LKERESETGVLIGVEIKAQTLSSHPLTSNPLSQISRCSDAGDGAPMMVMGSITTRYAVRTRDCDGNGYLVRGKTWLLTAQWVVCGCSMVVADLNGWHWVFGDESQVVPEISSRSPRTAASAALSIQLLFLLF
jgi:hypothetical protein